MAGGLRHLRPQALEACRAHAAEPWRAHPVVTILLRVNRLAARPPVGDAHSRYRPEGGFDTLLSRARCGGSLRRSAECHSSPLLHRLKAYPMSSRPRFLMIAFDVSDESI